MAEQKGIKLVHTELVRDSWLFPQVSIHSPEDLVSAMQSLLSNLDREMLVSVHCSTKGRVISLSICSIGTMNQALVEPSGIYRTAILAGANHIFLLHNHPSGRPEPSKEDLRITKRMAKAGDLLGVTLTDHVIIGEKGEFFSFRDKMPQWLEADAELNKFFAAEAVEENGFYDAAREKREALREETVEELLDLMRDGKSMFDPGWSKEAMAPKNPVTGTVYKGSNRLILMIAAKKCAYQDPRWLTYKNLSSLGYRVRKGEHPKTLEKWKFTEKRQLLDENGNPVLNERGIPVFEEMERKPPLYRTFQVYNGEQIEGFPPYQPKPQVPSELEEKVDALIKSAECTVLETAQDEAFYQRGCDTVYLPLRSAFGRLEGFASTAAHELIHSTGHQSRLNREFGSWPENGPPDDAYCREELRAELGALFLMNDLKIPLEEGEKRSSAAYAGHYLWRLKEDPNTLFRAAADAGKAEEYLLARYEKIRTLDREEEKIPENPNRVAAKKGRTV